MEERKLHDPLSSADAAAKSKLAGTSVDEAKLAIKDSEGDAASVVFMNANEGFCQSSVFMYNNKGGAPGVGAAGEQLGECAAWKSGQNIDQNS